MTTAASRWNFDAYLGSAFNPEMWYYDDAEDPVDLTTYGVKVVFADASGDHLLTLSKAASTVTVDENGLITFTLSVAQIRNLDGRSASINYSITLTPPVGSPFRLIEGRLLIHP